MNSSTIYNRTIKELYEYFGNPQCSTTFDKLDKYHGKFNVNTSARLQQFMNKYQQLQALYHSLAKHTHNVNFHNGSLRDRDHHGRLERSFFAIAAQLALDADVTQCAYTIMITASHNPPGYNGLKVDSIFGDSKLNEHEVTQVANNQQNTMKLIEKLTKSQSNNGFFYIGRDKRPTSSRLSQIIKSTLTILGRQVIDLGERSTPETLSLSQYLYERHLNGQKFTQKVVFSYFQHIQESFTKSIELISQNMDKKWKKKTLSLDFSKGVGGESFKNYDFLQKYFNIHTINFQDFSHPNENCGAQWVCKYFNQHQVLPSLQKNPKAQQYYYFDGDSDRIIATMGHQNALIDGDDFNACFITFIKELMSSIQLEKQQICSVGNITSNDALEKYMKTINVNFIKVPVGVKSLWIQIKKHEIGSFFQSSGHGSLYFSQNIIRKLRQFSSKNWQAELLLLLHALSRNNSRGYALHDMLIFQIYLYYFGAKSGFLFEKLYILNRSYEISKIEMFVNGKTGSKVLEEPYKLVEIVSKMGKIYADESIMIRKSSTSPVIRLTIQGKREKCQQILKKIEPQILLVLKQIQNMI